MHILERTIPIKSIESLSMSTLYDDIVVLHVPTEFDCILETPFKTELVAWLNGYGGVQSKVTFSNTYLYSA